MASSRQDARSPPPGPSLSRFASSSSLASSVPGSPSVSGGGSPNMSMRRIPSSGWGKVGTSGDPALSKRRAKNLLRDYYGLSAQGGDAAGTGAGAGDGAVKGKGKDRGDYRDDDFDSPHFDAQRFFDNFVSKATLPQLLDQANTLMGEVRELDGERQSLVYNHHHELVEASGTIGKMKATSETLDTSLDQLQSSFSSISSLTASLARPKPAHPIPSKPPPAGATNVKPRFDEATHIPPLLSLPILLRSLLSSRQRAEADRLWGEWEPALRSFEEAGVKGAKEVGAECRDVLRNARRPSVSEQTDQSPAKLAGGATVSAAA